MSGLFGSVFGTGNWALSNIGPMAKINWGAVEVFYSFFIHFEYCKYVYVLIITQVNAGENYEKRELFFAVF